MYLFSKISKKQVISRVLEKQIRSTALERSVITIQSCLHENNISKLAASQSRLVGCPLGVPISYYNGQVSVVTSPTSICTITMIPHLKVDNSQVSVVTSPASIGKVAMIPHL